MAKNQKVAAGQQFRPDALTWNSMVEAARAIAENKQSLTSDPLQQAPYAGTLVKVRNATGKNLARFSIVGLDSPLIHPASNEAEFLNQISFVGVVPGESYAGRWGVFQEPVLDGAIGRCLVDGVTITKVAVAYPTAPNWFAECMASTDQLDVYDATGSARILWRAGTGSVQWAIVRIGNNKLPTTLTAYLAEDLPSFKQSVVVTPDDLIGLPLPRVSATNLFRLAGDAGDPVAIYWDHTPVTRGGGGDGSSGGTSGPSGPLTPMTNSPRGWVIVNVQHKRIPVVESLELRSTSYGGYGSGSNEGGCQNLIAKARRFQAVYCSEESKLEEKIVGSVGGCGGSSEPPPMMMIEMPE